MEEHIGGIRRAAMKIAVALANADTPDPEQTPKVTEAHIDQALNELCSDPQRLKQALKPRTA